MGSRELKADRALDETTLELLAFAMAHVNFSARAFDGMPELARTIADPACRDRILGGQVSEAVQYRSLDRQWWV